MRRAHTLLLVMALAACRPSDERQPVSIAVTPDVAATGLGEMLAAKFTAETRVPAAIIVTEERFLVAAAKENDVNVVITTSPAVQRDLQRAGLVRLAETVAYNDFVLVGPKRDPAKAGKAATAADALRLIARRDLAFCSPIDVPHLREREAELWAASKASPKDDRRYRRCSGPAVDVLLEASRRNAYTLTDRSTWANRGRGVDVVPLLQGTAMLHHDYSVILVGNRQRKNAEWFVQWVMSYRGREAIEKHRFGDDRRLFVSKR